jgi:hypothetical protein
MIGVATATLNLDTTVAFLTPVLVHTARSREGARLPCCRGACCCPMRARCSWSGRTSEPDRPGPAAPQRRGLPGADGGPALAALVVTAAVVERAAGTGRRQPAARASSPAARSVGARASSPAARSVGARAGLGRSARCPADYTEARWCVAVRRARFRGLLLGEGWIFTVGSASREIRSRLLPP